MCKDFENNNLLAVYNALVAYQNNLVQIRFTIAALYLAASGFLIGALFNGCLWSWPKLILSILAIIITFIVYILELRTYQLLVNLGREGRKIESIFRHPEIDHSNIKGFFDILEKQYDDIRPRVPFKCKKQDASLSKGSKIVNYFVSHSRGLDFLYLFLILFWVTYIILFIVNKSKSIPINFDYII